MFLFLFLQGMWSPQKIPNPEYFEDPHPFRMTPIGAIGLELWSMTSDIYFDNFIICSEKEVADRWAADGWGFKKLVASANEVSMHHTPLCLKHILLSEEISCAKTDIFKNPVIITCGRT